MVDNAALADVADVTISNVDKKTKPGEILVRLCNYTDVYYNQYIRSDMDFMDATATEREISRCSLYEGDVVITKDSEKDDDIGVPAYVSADIDDLVCGYHLVILRPKPDKIDGKCLLYSLSAREAEHQFHARANGVTRFELRKADIGTVSVPLPPLPEQRRIAHILGTLDDKIELNRRMNETLEEMARAVFKDWFVDFGPVRAKMEGREAYLPDEVWELFPDRLVESELGLVPEGGGRALDDLVEVFGGTTPSTKVDEYWEGGNHWWATPKDLSTLDSPVLLETNRKITDAGLAKIGSGLHPPGTDLLSSRASIGHLAVAEIPVAVNQGFIAMQPRDGVSNLFMLFWCETFGEEITNNPNGSTFLEIGKRNFKRIRAVMPPGTVMVAFQNHVLPIYRKIVADVKEAKHLAERRDALSPVLIAGNLPKKSGISN